MKLFLVIIVLLGVFVSCTPDKPLTSALVSMPPRKEQKVLSKAHGEYRKSYISDLQYKNIIDLTSQDNYSGTTIVQFELRRAVPLTLDFYQGQVKALVVNGQPAPTKGYNGYYLDLPKGLLRTGPNKVEVSFTRDYGGSGVGLYQFIDPQDQERYLFTDFEPYDASMMYPCFDQPDLKAKYETQAKVPAHWKVVSATKESEVEDLGAQKVWTFPPSELISTYIYSLHAGPYNVWESEAKTKHHAIPIRLMARKSVAKYIDPEDWFVITRQGFNFFESYFDYPYPYKKYDQVIVPDFNSGAMENLAAVTFNEQRYVFKGEPTYAQRARRANVILHEMAHMWFGNLVTMKWWDDLWLNESFATFAAFLAQSRATEFKQAWLTFSSRVKGSAYWEDQLVTTHPIVNSSSDTDEAFAQFDGITYGKGASVIQQLVPYVTEEKFQKGLRNYFRKYANSNTELVDFLREMELASNKDLKFWGETWLETAQVSRIEVNPECENKLLKAVTLKQINLGEVPSVKRPHSFELQLFQVSSPGIKEWNTKTVSFSGEVHKEKLDEPYASCEKSLLVVNGDQKAYVRWFPDAQSKELLIKNISSLPLEHLRLHSWQTLWKLVVDGELSAKDFLLLAKDSLPQEKNLIVLGYGLGRLTQVVNSLLPKHPEAAKQFFEQQRDRISEIYWRGLKKASSADAQKIWLTQFLDILFKKRHQRVLVEFLRKKPSWLKFDLGASWRWKILTTLAEKNYDEIEPLIARELKRDKSLQAQRNALAAKTLLPEVESKSKLLEELKLFPEKKNVSLGSIKPILRNLQGPYGRRSYNYARSSQEPVVRELSSQTQAVLEVLLDQAPEYQKELANLIVRSCDSATAKSLQSFYEKNIGRMGARLKKAFLVTLQENQRCKNIREKAI